MTGREPVPEALIAALREIAAADAPELLARARGQARERAAALIEDALVRELVQAAATPRPASEPHQSTTGPVGGTAWWAYCVLAATDAAAWPQLDGVEPGGRSEVVTEGDLAALVSEVPLAEYDDQRLRQHLEDLAWVERVARAHEAVLDRALSEATIVPLRLCTIYRDREGVRRLLAENAAPLTESLAAVDGCQEWGLKLFLDRRQAAAPPEATPESSSPEAERAATERTGAAYLARKRDERTAATRAAETLSLTVEAIDERLRAVARASTSNPPQRPEAHGRPLEMILNTAYLVERERVGELQEVVGTLQAEHDRDGLVLELTGPWPAYNFVSSAAGLAS